MINYPNILRLTLIVIQVSQCNYFLNFVKSDTLFMCLFYDIT